MFDIKKSFTYMSKDQGWVKKFIIGSLLMLIPTIVSFVFQFLPEKNDALLMKFLPLIIAGIILTILFSSIITGYYYTVINNKVKDNSDLLPDWKNIGSYILISIKALIGVILLSIPFGGALLLIVYLSKVLQAVNPLLTLLILLLLIPLTLIYIFTLLVMFMSFAYDLKISSYLNIKQGFALLKNNVLMYIIYLALCIALSSIMRTISFILGLTVVGILALPFLAFYVTLVSADLAAQFIQNSELVKNKSNLEIEKKEEGK